MPTFELQSKSDFPKQAYFGSNTLIKVLPDKEKKLFHNALRQESKAIFSHLSGHGKY